MRNEVCLVGNAKRKVSCIIMSAILIAVLVVCIESETVQAQSHDDVWVDDDFLLENETHHRTITSAEQYVADGGTIHVHSGIYEDPVTITKNVTVHSLNGSDETVVGDENLHLSGATFSIDAGLTVTISGFRIEGLFDGTIYGISADTGAKVTVTNNVFDNLYYGVKILEGYLFAESNEFNTTSQGYQPVGVFMDGGSIDSVIVNNTFQFDIYGIGVRIDKTAIRLIANNTFNQSTEGNEPGMGEHSGNIGMSNMGLTTGYTIVRNNTIINGYWGVMSEGTNATVENNTFTGCRRCVSSAVYYKWGFPELAYPSGLTVANNTISPVEFGLQVANNWSYMKAYNNTVTGLGTAYVRGVNVNPKGRMDLGPNNTISNVQVGVKTYGAYGGSFTNATNNTIFGTSEGFHSEGTDNVYHNLFYSNDEGIRIQGNANRDISNNTIIGSSKRAGIWILSSSNNKKVQCNNISQGYRGIWITGQSSNNVISWNDISDNDVGIHLAPSASISPNSNILLRNNISFNNHGVLVDQTDGTTIEGNDIANSFESGIFVSDSEYTNITQSNITNNYIGIDVYSGNNSLINDNSLLGNVLWAINATNYVNASGNYFGTNDDSRIDKLVSENVNYSNPLFYRESGVNFTEDRTILNDTEFTQGYIVNGSLTVNPNVNITFTNKTGHNFIQVNGAFVIISDSILRATHGNFTLLATNGSDSNLSNSWFERQMGIGIQTTNMTVTNCTFINGTSGIVVNQGVSNTIQDSDFISNSRYGIYLFGSGSNIIQDNLIALSPKGIMAYNSTLDALSWNNISANEYGIKVALSSDASIHNNTVTNNHIGISVHGSLYIKVNNNTLVGNVHLAIFVPAFSIGTNANYNYFGTNDSEQIEKLCQGVSCSHPLGTQNPNFDYIDSDTDWITPRNLTKGVIVNANLTVDSTQVLFNNSQFHNFIQVNGKLEVNSSSFEGNEGSFTVLYLYKSVGGFGNSSLMDLRGVGVQSESNFLVNDSTFANGTYGLVFWKAKHAQVSNSTFESNEKWGLGLFMSDENKIELSQISNNSIGVYVYASCSNNLSQNLISDNSQGIWLDSKRLRFTMMGTYPKSNTISSNELYNNDVGVLASYSDGNSVSLNTFSSNWIGTGVEISSRHARKMTVSWNLFEDNEYGILISDSTENDVNNNTFASNLNSIDIGSSRVILMCNGTYDCYPVTYPNNVVNANNISIEESSAFGIRLIDTHYNIMGNNTVYAVAGGTGVWIENSDNNTIMDNSVTSTNTSRGTHGIRLENAGANNLTKNTISNYSYNFGVMGEKLWDFVQTIDTLNTVDGKKIYYWVDEDGNNSYYNSDGGFYGFVNSTSIIVENASTQYNLQGFLLAYSYQMHLKNISDTHSYYGAHIYRSNDSEVEDGVFSDGNLGLYLYHSDHIAMENVSASNDENGVYMYESENNTVSNSTFSSSHHSLYLDSSNSNVISHVYSTDVFGGAGIYLYKSHHNLIANNTTISSSVHGIELDYSYYNNISQCILSQNRGIGVLIKYGGSNNISRCEVMEQNDYGVYIMYSSWNNIANNTIHNNTRGIWIFVSFSKNNLMANNEIANNSEYGIRLQAPENVIVLNNITNNGGYAVEVHDSGLNQIIHNNIFFNKGILIKNSDQNNISENYIVNSSGNGIRIENGADNVINHNNISNSGSDGIHIQDAPPTANNSITYNSITSNSGYGVKLTGSGRANTIYHNNFICNKGDCDDAFEGYDEYVPPMTGDPPSFWDDYVSTGNYWTNWTGNPGGGDYLLEPFVDPVGNRDRYPVLIPFPDTGPTWS